MLILGIETSCDETAAAIVEDGTTILSNVVASSQELHIKYRGILPDRAAREQVKSIIPVLEEAVSGKRLAYREIDAIAVTVGPGLIGSLLVGVETAKALAFVLNKPLIPVNHLVGHLYANWITNSSQFTVNGERVSTVDPAPQFPAVALLVSGGHSDLVLMTGHGKFVHLGSTRDDAAGECFDKCGRLLGLPYPYGPYIDLEAQKFEIQNPKSEIKLPRPMLHSKDYDFSFSGLKTAFLNEFNKLSATRYPLSTPLLAYELQEAVTDVLVAKTINAVKKYQPRSLLLAGGVAANTRLREKMKFQISNFKFQIDLYVPPLKLCTDNAAYIAAAAFYLPVNTSWDKIEANPGLTIMD